jgi:hypothetical protein
MEADDGYGTYPKPVITFFFLLGVVSAIAFRSLTIAQKTHPHLVRTIWYIAVLGYILFFYYRYSIARRRRETVEKHGLIRKLESDAPLSVGDRQHLHYIVSSLMKSKEIHNYHLLFLLSILAIVVDIIIHL